MNTGRVLSLSVITLLMVIAGCSKKAPELTGDARLRKMIVGTWILDHGGTITINADGSSSSHFGNGSRTLTYQTTWLIQDGQMIVTIEGVSDTRTNHEPVGAIDILKIIALNETNLTWASGNQVISLERQQ